MAQGPRRTTFTEQEIDTIYALLEAREHGENGRHIWVDLHRLGFYFRDYEKQVGSPFLASDLVALLDSGAIQVTLDEDCAVCAHSTREHIMADRSESQTRGEGYFDVSLEFCLDCPQCTDDGDGVSDFVSSRGGRSRRLAQGDTTAITVDDMIHRGFSIVDR